MSSSNDAMDVHNGAHRNADGQHGDPVLDDTLEPQPHMEQNWEPGPDLLLELKDLAFGALPEVDRGADGASDKPILPARDATSILDPNGQGGGLSTDNGTSALATGSYRCPSCKVDILYLTKQRCQAHMDYGRHMYPEDDPAQDAVSSVTRFYERNMDCIQTYWNLLRHHGQPQNVLQETPGLTKALATSSALYYADIRSLFNQQLGAAAGPEPMLKALHAHDKWAWQYCVYVLGRPPKCDPLAPKYEHELRQNGAMIVDRVPNWRFIMMAPHPPFWVRLN